MKKIMKKATVLFLTIALLLSASFTMVMAADGAKLIAPENDIYTGDTFEITFQVEKEGMEGIRQAELYLTFDSDVIVPCDASGDEITTWTEGNGPITSTIPATHYLYGIGVDTDELQFSILQSPTGSPIAADGRYDLATIKFKAVGTGTTTVAKSEEETKISSITDSNRERIMTVTGTSITVNPSPKAPVASNAEVALSTEATTPIETAKSGDTVTTFYTFHNGNTVDGTELVEDGTSGNISDIVWYVGEDAQEGDATAGQLELPLTDAMVGSEVFYTVYAKADRTKKPNVQETEEAVASTKVMVQPADEYKPEVAFIEGKLEVLAGEEVPEITAEGSKANITVAGVNENSDITVKTVTWYLLAEGKEADYAALESDVATFLAENATEIEAVEGVVEIAKENNGRFVVAAVTVTDAIANIDRDSDVAYSAAIEVETKKSAAPSRDDAPSLTPTVKPEEPTPGEDEPVVEPEDPTDDPAGEPIASGAEKFTDLPKEKYGWAIENIDVLAKAGIIKGMTEETFEPEAKMTIAQFTAMIVRALALKAEEGAESTLVNKEHWSFAEMSAADSLGLLTFFEGKVDPDAEIVRDQMFAIAYAGLKAANIELKADADAIEYTDKASIGSYATEAVEALTKAGITNGMGDGTLAPKGTTTRAQGAKVIGLIFGLSK